MVTRSAEQLENLAKINLVKVTTVDIIYKKFRNVHSVL